MSVGRGRRVVVKVGSSSLTGADGGLDTPQITALVDALAAARSAGDEVVLVSSGAIAAGLAPLRLPRRPRDLATQQAAASVGQGLLMQRYADGFSRHGFATGQVLLTVDDMTRRSHYRNAYRTFAKLLELGVVPVVNENDTVATTEIRFGDNDRLAALVAHLVHADLLVLLSDVEGLFTGPPGSAGAELVTDVRTDDDLGSVDVTRSRSNLGTGGMVTKLESARIATGAGVEVVLASADQVGRALGGERVGTRFHPTGSRRPTRLLWLAHATEGKGRLRIDEGAVHALRERRKSLLPAGVVEVTGSFATGDPVDVIDDAGTVVARGLVNYDSEELPRLLGRSTRDLAAELGTEYEREVIHRDDLVLLGARRR